ncbi:MAG: carbohydrate kinase family protein [Acidobacteriota bacterium]
MRVAILGTVLLDTIERPDGQAFNSLGGIAHSVAMLAALSAGEIRIQPVCRIGVDLWDSLVAAWEPLPGVELSALIRDRRDNPRNRLDYGSGGGERRERLSGLLPPLSADEVTAAADADLVLVNCITGADCTLAAIEWLSHRTGRLYLDLHSLALGLAADGWGHYRRPTQWRKWIECADVVQCNRAEAATLAAQPPATAEPERLLAFLERQLAAGRRPPASRLSVIALTLGAEGARLSWIERRRIQRTRLAAAPITVVDPTGAGDAFGAGYCMAWLQGANVQEAGAVAVRSGTIACTFVGAPKPAELQRALSR